MDVQVGHAVCVAVALTVELAVEVGRGVSVGKRLGEEDGVAVSPKESGVIRLATSGDGVGCATAFVFEKRLHPKRAVAAQIIIIHTRNCRVWRMTPPPILKLLDIFVNHSQMWLRNPTTNSGSSGKGTTSTPQKRVRERASGRVGEGATHRLVKLNVIGGL